MTLNNCSIALLKYLNNNCGKSGYKVLSTEEIISALPEDLKTDSEGLYQSFSELSVNDYISVKYQDDNEVCLSLLPKGRSIYNSMTEKSEEKISFNKTAFNYAFIGALLGSVISSLIIIVFLLLR